jgi:hypothetical protein
MKVIEDTPHRFKLKHVPIGEWCRGGVMIAGSLGLLIYLIGSKSIFARLTCDRPTPTQTNCDLKQYGFLRQTAHVRIFDPQGTEIISRSSGRGRTQQIRIISPTTDVIFLPGSNGLFSNNPAIAAKIDDYINNPQTRSLWVSQQDRLAFIFFLCGLVGVGSGIFFTLTPNVTCSFYKRMDKVIIERRRWNGKNALVEEHLSNILTAEIEEKRVKNGKAYRVMLVLASAEGRPIHEDFISKKAQFAQSPSGGRAVGTGIRCGQAGARATCSTGKNGSDSAQAQSDDCAGV